MTEKQRRFVEAYMALGGTPGTIKEAAEKAGLSYGYARRLVTKGRYMTLDVTPEAYISNVLRHPAWNPEKRMDDLTRARVGGGRQEGCIRAPFQLPPTSARVSFCAMLTHKQQQFVEAYIANNGNATKAARAAGYAGSYATIRQIGCKNLKRPAIRRAIETRKPEAFEAVRETSRQRRPSLIYVIKAEGLNRYKVGITRQEPEARVVALQCGSPLPLHLVGTIAGGRTEEARLHRLLEPFRVHGEWFDLKPLDVEYILSEQWRT